MPKIEEHEKIVKELIEDIEEKIRLNLIVKRQKIIGFSVSEAATNLFAIFLQKNKFLDPGFNVNHRFFSSERIAKKTFPFEFPKKEKIISHLTKIEDYRNRLCYGRDKDAKEVQEAIKLLFSLKEILEEET